MIFSTAAWVTTSSRTTLGTTAFAGEISYRQDEPLQIDDVELLFAAIPDQALRAGDTPEENRLSQMPYQTGACIFL